MTVAQVPILTGGYSRLVRSSNSASSSPRECAIHHRDRRTSLNSLHDKWGILTWIVFANQLAVRVPRHDRRADPNSLHDRWGILACIIFSGIIFAWIMTEP